MAKTKIISYSELDAYRQCPLKHQLGYMERWTKPVDDGTPLALGSLWHHIMEEHYRELMAWQNDPTGDPVERCRQRVLPILHETGPDGKQTPDQELIEWMYDGYVEQYGYDPDWRILAVEHSAQAWLPTDRGTRSSFKLKMKIDLIVRWKDHIWGIDHKSTSRMKSQQELDLHDQPGLYTWGMRQLGKPVLGFQFSMARTKKLKRDMTLDERFERKPTFRTDEELNEIAIDAYKTARLAYGAHNIDGEDAPRSTNPDTCRWRCDFTDPCLASRKGLDRVELLRDFGFAQDFTRH